MIDYQKLKIAHDLVLRTNCGLTHKVFMEPWQDHVRSHFELHNPLEGCVIYLSIDDLINKLESMLENRSPGFQSIFEGEIEKFNQPQRKLNSAEELQESISIEIEKIREHISDEKWAVIENNIEDICSETTLFDMGLLRGQVMAYDNILSHLRSKLKYGI